MDSLEFNKIAGTILGMLLFFMGLGVAADAIYFPGRPTKPGYALPGAPEGGEKAAGDKAAGDKGGADTAKEEPLPVLLAKADDKKGQADTKACQACHNFDKGAAAKVGPPLWGIVGRKVASVAGFEYSEALKGKGGEWTYDELNKFIAAPGAYVKGTKMSYAGEKDSAKRADIIDYLHTLADTPVPLPK
jgi:cytochrome c